MEAIVQRHALGYVTTIDGAAWPKTPWGRALLVFLKRKDARAYADALNADDMPAAHEAIARGKWYEEARDVVSSAGAPGGG